jgi:undecaprenyl-diphosphatase
VKGLDSLMRTIFTGLNELDALLSLGILKLHRFSWLGFICRALSRSADGYLYPVIPLVLWLSGSEQAFVFLISTAAAYAVDIPLFIWIKNQVKRERPFASLEGVTERLRAPDRFSFPSGHTASAFVMAFLILFFLPTWVGTIGLIWASLVGFSRVYLGVHYPTDVVAGTALGFFSASLGFLLSIPFH